MSKNTKKILTERMNSTLEYIKESGLRDGGKHYLGKLSGIGAEFAKPTRNGRRYPLELWKNIQNSEDFKEAMATLTCFGEADHPEERADTSLKEVAIVLTNMEIKESEGYVKVDFDILDTPNGRLLKEILDYGSKIGVSTRGIGDEVVKNGETIIDPDTYIFYGFDAVVMPAVKSARPAVVEAKSAKAKSILETFNKEIEDATTPSELNSIKRIAESANLPNVDSLLESIDIKMESLEGEDISSKLLKDIGDLSKENEILKEQLEQFKSSEIADDIGIKRVEESLINRTKELQEANKLLKAEQENNKKVFKNYNLLLNKLFKMESKIAEKEEQRNKLVKEYKELKTGSSRMIKSITNLKSNLTKRESDLKLSESKLYKTLDEVVEKTQLINELKQKENNLIKEKISLKKVNDNLADLNVELVESNNNLKTKLDIIPQLNNKIELLENEILKTSDQKKLIESNLKEKEKEESNQIKQLNSLVEKTLNDYLEVRCKQNNVDKETVLGLLSKNYNTEDIDKVVNNLSDRARRLNKVPFVIQPRTVTLNESVNLNDEDKQTINFLKDSFNK